jgi:hypothetical protein
MATNQIKAINLMTQWIALKKAFPSSSGDVRRNQLRWTTELMPSSLSDTYRIRLEYSLEKSPKVVVEEPCLQERDGKKPPHVYREGSLCLYLPGAREWDDTMLLADTIVPWTSEWLLHYEIWLATGEWHGGGVHPGDGVKIQNDKPDARDRKSVPPKG